MEVALRKLRAFAREGAQDELDLEGTIDATAKNAGELEVVTRPPRRPNTRVILMMDVGGSMDPYAQLVSRLFSAAKQATHFKELRTYYFHNCVYGRVLRPPYLASGISVPDLLAQSAAAPQADHGGRRADGAVRADDADERGGPLRSRGRARRGWCG